MKKAWALVISFSLLIGFTIFAAEEKLDEAKLKKLIVGTWHSEAEVKGLQIGQWTFYEDDRFANCGKLLYWPMHGYWRVHNKVVTLSYEKNGHPPHAEASFEIKNITEHEMVITNSASKYSGYGFTLTR